MNPGIDPNDHCRSRRYRGPEPLDRTPDDFPLLDDTIFPVRYSEVALDSILVNAHVKCMVRRISRFGCTSHHHPAGDCLHDAPHITLAEPGVSLSNDR